MYETVSTLVGKRDHVKMKCAESSQLRFLSVHGDGQK
jgi:hypothetical protein